MCRDLMACLFSSKAEGCQSNSLLIVVAGTQATIEGVFSSFVAATPIDDDKQSTADYGMTHSDDEHR